MNQKRPSRVYVLSVYIKRFLRWQRTSYPFLTIDAFAALADYRFNPVRWRLSDRNLVNIVNAEVIFCKSEELEILFRNHPGIKAKVIICGNSDFEFHKIPSGIPKSVRALFLQNSFISDNHTIFTLPIGIENFRWGVNGNPKLLDRILNKGVKDEILVGPFGKTHPVRREVYLLLRCVEMALTLIGYGKVYIVEIFQLFKMTIGVDHFNILIFQSES